MADTVYWEYGMGQFVYSTKASARAPLLLDRTSLESLDRIIGEEEQRLIAANERAIQQQAEQKFRGGNEFGLSLEQITEQVRSSHDFCTRERKFGIAFKGGKTFRGESVAEILRQPEVEKDLPIALAYRLEIGRVKADISASKRAEELEISVSPEHLSESRELFAALQSWANGVRSPKWQTVLQKFGWLTWFVLLFFLLGIYSFRGDLQRQSGKAALRQHALSILTNSNGLQQKDELKAIQLTLQFEAELFPPKSIAPDPAGQRRMFWIFVFSGIACVIISIWPKVEIGIGAGERRIGFWRIWMRIAFFTIPTWLVGVLFTPKIESFIKALL